MANNEDSQLPVLTDNPKDIAGGTKVPVSCIPAGVMLELAASMYEGSLKYGRANYRVAKIKSSIYYDAAIRHLTAWWEGEDIDQDSGMPHIVKAIATLFVLRDGQICSNNIDDRPPKMPEGWQAEINKKIEAMKAKYPHPRLPCTEIPNEQ